MSFAQVSLFDSGLLDVKTVEVYEPFNHKKKTKWNPSGWRVNNQLSIDDYDGFPDPSLVKRLHNAIINRNRILREEFDEYIGIVAYQRFFNWTGHVTYTVKIRVNGPLPYATALGVDLHENGQDESQMMFFDYRHLAFGDCKEKPWVFGSIEEKTEYLRWAKDGI